MKLTFWSINLYEIKEKTSITLKQHDVGVWSMNCILYFMSFPINTLWNIKTTQTSCKDLANNISTWSTTNCAMSIKRMIESVSVHTNSPIYIYLSIFEHDVERNYVEHVHCSLRARNLVEWHTKRFS